MKNKINWRTFFLLLGTSVVTSFMILPYIFALTPAIAKLFTSIVLLAQMVQATIIFSISIFVGLLLAKKVGLEMPILEGKKPIGYLKSNLKLSVGLGVLSGILIILMSIPFGSMSLTFLKAETGVATWKGLMASFYGGITEEIVFRLFLMTLLVWISTKITRTVKPTNIGMWISIIVSTIIFGLGHLGITGGLTAITLTVVLRAIILNGVSIFFGWLYWKKGLEAAMVAHFSADIVVHVITPLIAGWFI